VADEHAAKAVVNKNKSTKMPSPMRMRKLKARSKSPTAKAAKRRAASPKRRASPRKLAHRHKRSHLVGGALWGPTGVKDATAIEAAAQQKVDAAAAAAAAKAEAAAKAAAARATAAAAAAAARAAAKDAAGLYVIVRSPKASCDLLQAAMSSLTANAGAIKAWSLRNGGYILTIIFPKDKAAAAFVNDTKASTVDGSTVTRKASWP